MCYVQPCIVFIYNYCSINFMCVVFYYKFYVFFYYKFILIEKFIKHNEINYSCCDVRYLDLYFSLGFLNFIFVYCWWIVLLYICKKSNGGNYLATTRPRKFRGFYILKLIFEVCIILILNIRSRYIDGYIKYFCRHLTKCFWSLQ